MVADKEIFKLSSKEFKAKLDIMSDSELTKFIHDMNPSQRRVFLDKLTNSEILFYRSKLPKSEKKRFMNLLLQDGKALFWEKEALLVEQGKGTRNWTPNQQKQILSGIVPRGDDGFKFEAHHMLSKEDNPKYAADADNFEALTKINEHLRGVHNGHTKIETHGYYDELTGNMIIFKGEGVPGGYPPIVQLTELSTEVKALGKYDANWEKRFEDIFPGFSKLDGDQKTLVQRLEAEYVKSKYSENFIDYVVNNSINKSSSEPSYVSELSWKTVDGLDFDSFEIPQKYKDLLRVSDLDDITSKKIKQLIYMLEVKKVDAKSINMDDILKDCCPSSSVIDTFREMQADDVAELMGRNVENTGGRYTLKGCVTILTPHDLGIDTWLLENKAKLVKALRDDANLGKIVSKGGTVIFTAVDLVDFADICGDIYLGIKYNTMTADEAGEKMLSWGCATIFSEAGAEAGAAIGAAIGSAVLPPLGTIAGGLIGGLCGGTLGYILGQWFGETFYDDLSAGAFNFWDSVLSDGRHFLEGASSDDVLNFAHGEKGQFSIREFFTSPDITDITFDIESKGGNDYISGFQNSDKLVGGSGSDMIIGCGGNDIIYGDEIENVYNESETYDDIIYGGSGEDEIHGGLGNDIIYGDGIENQADATEKDIFWIPKPRTEEEYWMSISGEFENFNPYSASDTAFGDNISGDEGSDVIYAGLGNDTVHGGYDSDIIYGEVGNDHLYGDEGDDFIVGGAGSDYIEGGTGDDIIIGGSEDDNDATGYNDDDTIYGQEGNDTISVNLGSNKISGGIGNDYIYGGRDSDRIYGDNDTLEDGMNDGD
ncbi:MAG: calcium-binding protein, partial [Oscillospiraceae bacterium]|nr:calcium-binding protein [Oscillospiraceae bacterium]